VDYASWLRQQRREKDELFRRSPHSPIEPGQWKPLEYYEPDEAYRVEATWSPTKQGRRIRMPTSTGEERDYVEAGRFSFRVGGAEQSLAAYASEARGEESLFVPFRDATSGKETYGAGRYLDVPVPDGPRAEIDFNLCYHPYCAYNDAYSCPLPPRENWLTVPIRAGERSDH
jgi:uncharacterized protein (DUF1684 family)